MTLPHAPTTPETPTPATSGAAGPCGTPNPIGSLPRRMPRLRPTILARIRTKGTLPPPVRLAAGKSHRFEMRPDDPAHRGRFRGLGPLASVGMIRGVGLGWRPVRPFCSCPAAVHRSRSCRWPSAAVILSSGSRSCRGRRNVPRGRRPLDGVHCPGPAASVVGESGRVRRSGMTSFNAGQDETGYPSAFRPLPRRRTDRRRLLPGGPPPGQPVVKALIEPTAGHGRPRVDRQPVPDRERPRADRPRRSIPSAERSRHRRSTGPALNRSSGRDIPRRLRSTCRRPGGGFDRLRYRGHRPGCRCHLAWWAEEMGRTLGSSPRPPRYADARSAATSTCRPTIRAWPRSAGISGSPSRMPAGVTAIPGPPTFPWVRIDHVLASLDWFHRQPGRP